LRSREEEIKSLRITPLERGRAGAVWGGDSHGAQCWALFVKCLTEPFEVMVTVAVVYAHVTDEVNKA